MKAAVAFARRQSQRRGWNLTNKEINRTARLALNTTSRRRARHAGDRSTSASKEPEPVGKSLPEVPRHRKAAAADQGAKYIAAVMASLEAVEQVTVNAVRARMRRYA